MKIRMLDGFTICGPDVVPNGDGTYSLPFEQGSAAVLDGYAERVDVPAPDEGQGQGKTKGRKTKG